jgi:hypothetical protein
MIKFFCGMAIGILAAVALFYGTQDKFGGIVVGAIVGVGIVISVLILFFQSCAETDATNRKEQQHRDRWWLNGDRPPWEDN